MEGISNRILHITVGTTPSQPSPLDLTHELRLLKAALLYADKVKLCSLASSLLITSAIGVANMTEGDLLNLLYIVRPLAKDLDAVPIFIEQYKALRRKKRRTSQELLLLRRLEKQFEQTTAEMRATIYKLAMDSGAEGIVAAMNVGLVELQVFDSDKMAEAFVATIAEALSSGNTYPLLDDFAGNLVNLAIQAKAIVPSGASVRKAKQVGLSSDLLGKLPLFDNASVDEVIDIRKELERPLIRFRSAMSEFAGDIESAAWDKDFPAEAERIFFEKAAPAVLEIEEAYKSNNALMTLVSKFNEKPLAIPVASALGLLLSTQSQLPALVTQALALTAGAAAIALEATQEWREKNEAIERNQLYFYYGVRKGLGR